MKTTIEINDAILHRAKTFALEQDMPLRAVVEAALRQFLEARMGEPRPPSRLRRCSFGGNGLQPGIAEGDWDTIRALIYESRVG